MKRLLLLLLLLIPASVSAQVVAQGSGGASAWRVNFGGTAQPVSLADNANRLLGKVTFVSPQHIICDSGCTGLTDTDDGAVAGGQTSPLGISLLHAWNGDLGWVPVTSGAVGAMRVELQLDTNAGATTASTLRVALTSDSGVATEATQALIQAKLDIPLSELNMTLADASSNTYWFDGSEWQPVTAATPLPVTGPLTNTQLRASAVPVSGTFWQATQPVSLASVPTHGVTGTFWQATQPVSGPLTDAQLRATPIATTNSVWSDITFIQSGSPTSGAIAVGGVDFADMNRFMYPIPLTTGGEQVKVVCDSGCAAGAPGQQTMAASSPVVIASDQSAVPVSGPLTDTQIRASAIPVSGTFWQATQPVSGTVTTTPPSNASTNVAQLAGTATSVNSGTKDAGTLRVVIATDQPALTNKLLVTPDSVALPANQSVNVNQMAGVTPSLNTGVRDAGTQRVTIATNDLVPITDGAGALNVIVDSVTGSVAVTNAGLSNIPAQGQALAAASLPVVLTAAQVTTLTPPAAITGFATLAEQQTQTTALQLIDNAVSGAGFNVTQLAGVAPSLNTGVRDAGTQRVTIATNDSVPVTGTFWQATQPVSGTVTTTPPANASTNVAQLAGTATSVNSGVKDAGTLRVVIATDQPALTNKLLVTPDSVALPANQSVNVNQMGGVATSMNTGVRDTGTQRVTIATNDLVPVSAPTLTKGTQGAAGFTTQDLKDSGRTAISFYANAFASGATTVSKIITWDQSKGTGAVTAATASYTITNGKTLRITSLQVATRGSAVATIQTTTFALRLNTAGACVVGSTPILFAAESATPAVASAWDRVILPINDGYEIVGNGTISICLTATSTFTTNAPTWSVQLMGYEY